MTRGIMHHALAMTGSLIGACSCLRGIVGITRHVLSGGTHFLHRGRHLVNLGHLSLHGMVCTCGDARSMF
ncbi:hypothetical protein D3C85_1774900 [compost metagenome]